MVVKKESARTRVLDELKRIANNNCPYFLSTSLSNRICNTQDWYLFKKSKKRYFETVFEYKTKILKFTPEFYFENDIEFPGEFYNSPVRVLRSIVRSCVLLDLGIGTDQIQPDWTFRSGKTTLMIDDFTSLPEDIEQDFIVTTIDRKQLLERGGKCVVIPLTCQSKGSKKVLSEFYGANTSYFLKSYN
ncbi:MAG: hypothetical protein KC478_10655, partial [Bacteriovoracaceae bacterium]|nr:hypothetical protein [Bacteriovoracaceae bacterium]